MEDSTGTWWQWNANDTGWQQITGDPRAGATVSNNRSGGIFSGIGVNTHFGYTNMSYANTQMALSSLAYLGLNNVRDTLGQASGAAFTTAAQQGIQFVLVSAVGGTVDVNSVISAYDSFATANPGKLIGVEGPNEVYNWPVTYNGQSGLPGAAAFQQALYAAAKSDSTLSSLPLYNFSFGGGSPTDYAQIGNISAYMDYGNAHIYPQSSIGGGITPYTSLASNIPWETSVVSPNKPTAITEGGYYTMPDNNYGVNNDVQARYTLDYIFDTISRGCPAFYIYELLDDNADPGNTNMEDHFGLFTSDGTPKPAATAIHNLTTLLNGATATNASYTVSGLPSSGHTMSLSDTSGAAYLIVWAEPVIWNQSSDSETAAPTENVSVSLGKTYSTVQVFDPLTGTSPTASYSNASSAALGVTDHPLIVKMQ